jgi:rod shape determining protein RodA
MSFRNLKNIDWILFGATVFLMLLGLLAIYSISYAGGTLELLNFKKQVLFFVSGLGLALFLTLFDYRFLKKYIVILYILVIFLLILLFYGGVLIRGAASWFQFGIFSLQPSEIAKIIVVIVLAKYFSSHYEQMNRFSSILISGFYAALPAALIALQPDFGSALIILLIWLGMIIVLGINRFHLALFLSSGVGLFILSWLLFFKDYQKERILSFINPHFDPLGSGYHITQSITAIGSGSFFGKGLGYGSQSQLLFLPEAQTDFIFAAIGEELGFIGVVFLIILFGVLFQRMLVIFNKADNNFARMLVLGITIMLILEVAINIGMNMGLAPITGIPLPLVSYGGSALITTLAGIGILQSIKIRSAAYGKEKEKEIPEITDIDYDF